MKELKICLEINGLAEDELGNPDSVGLSIGVGMVPDDEYEKRVNEIRQGIEIKGILKLVGMEKIIDEKDCRLISQQEYEEKYGEK